MVVPQRDYLDAALKTMKNRADNEYKDWHGNKVLVKNDLICIILDGVPNEFLFYSKNLNDKFSNNLKSHHNKLSEEYRKQEEEKLKQMQEGM